jgi:hypothetical protein
MAAEWACPHIEDLGRALGWEGLARVAAEVAEKRTNPDIQNWVC